MKLDADHLIQAAVSGVQALRRFILGWLTLIPGIEKIRSGFALTQVLYDAVVPINVGAHVHQQHILCVQDHNFEVEYGETSPMLKLQTAPKFTI